MPLSLRAVSVPAEQLLSAVRFYVRRRYTRSELEDAVRRHGVNVFHELQSHLLFAFAAAAGVAERRRWLSLSLALNEGGVVLLDDPF